MVVLCNAIGEKTNWFRHLFTALKQLVLVGIVLCILCLLFTQNIVILFYVIFNEKCWRTILQL